MTTTTLTATSKSGKTTLEFRTLESESGFLSTRWESWKGEEFSRTFQAGETWRSTKEEADKDSERRMKELLESGF